MSSVGDFKVRDLLRMHCCEGGDYPRRFGVSCSEKDNRMQLDTSKKLFTVDEYYTMAEDFFGGPVVGPEE